jgi:hypothetical protein
LLRLKTIEDRLDAALVEVLDHLGGGGVLRQANRILFACDVGAEVL